MLGSRSNTDFDGAILAYPAKDTMKRAKDDEISEIEFTESRDNLWHALTPQLFRLQALFDCLGDASKVGHIVTDEASAMEFWDKKVRLVEGASDNIKLTSPSDLRLIEFLLKDK